MEFNLSKGLKWGVSVPAIIFAAACTTSPFDWSAEFFGNEGEEANASAITVDQQGNTYITGLVREENQLQQPRWYINKYDAEGNEVWLHRVDGTQIYGEEVVGKGKQILVDEDALYVLGTLGIPGAGNTAMTIAKFDLDGTRQWVHQVLGYFYTVDLAVKDGSVWLAGARVTTDNERMLQALMIDSDGLELWNIEESFEDQYLIDIDVDSLNNALITTRTEMESTIHKIDVTGVDQWLLTYSVPDYSVEFADVALDDNNNLYIVGHQTPEFSSSANGFVQKLDSDGNELWKENVDHFGFINEYGNNIQWNHGNVFATVNGGKVIPDGDVVLVSMDEETGEQLWKRVFNEGVNSVDTTPALKLNTQGEPVVMVNTLVYLPGGTASSKAHITRVDGSEGATASAGSFRGADVGVAADGGLMLAGEDAPLDFDFFKVQIFKYPN